MPDRLRPPPGAAWEYQRLVLPRGTGRAAAQALLVAAAEHGRWELDRLRLLPDGTRRVVLRRSIIRQQRTLVSPGPR